MNHTYRDKEMKVVREKASQKVARKMGKRADRLFLLTSYKLGAKKSTRTYECQFPVTCGLDIYDETMISNKVEEMFVEMEKKCLLRRVWRKIKNTKEEG